MNFKGVPKWSFWGGVWRMLETKERRLEKTTFGMSSHEALWAEKKVHGEAKSFRFLRKSFTFSRNGPWPFLRASQAKTTYEGLLKSRWDFKSPSDF